MLISAVERIFSTFLTLIFMRTSYGLDTLAFIEVGVDIKPSRFIQYWSRHQTNNDPSTISWT